MDCILKQNNNKHAAWIYQASRMGLVDRSVLREGLAADIVVFDLGTIEDTATWENATTKLIGLNGL